jgi:hypothetical protein
MHTLLVSPHFFDGGRSKMAEKVAKLGISRDKDFMLYVKDGAVWRVRRKQPGVPKGRPERVADGGFEMDNNYIYFVDRDGDVSRAKRAVGGQKRKKTKSTRAAAKRKPAARKASKKPASRKAARKPAKRGAKSGGRKKRR